MADDNQYNPMSTDRIEDILARREKAKEKETITQEEMAEYAEVVNKLFSTPEGKYFLNKMIKYCGIYSFDNRVDAVTLIEEKGRRGVYLSMIRPYLDQSILKELNV